MTSTATQASIELKPEDHREQDEDPFAPLDAHSRAIGLGLLLLAMAAATAMLIWALRDTIFGADEWALMFNAQNGSITEVFDPWNGHLLAVGRLLARASLALAGSDFWFLIALDIAGIIACSGLLYVYARRRIGPILALVPAMVPLFFSGASTFYGAGIQFTPLMGINAIYPLIFGLAALLLLERNDRCGDLAACVMLCLSLATFSYGIAFMAGATVAVLLSPSKWRRSFVIAIPLLLYGTWWIWASKQGSASSEIAPENFFLIPLYVSDSLAAVGAGFFGLSLMVGKGPAVSFALQGQPLSSLSLPLFLILIEVVAIFLIARGLGRRGLWRSSLWPPLATLIVLWSLQGLVLDILTRMPGDPRYLFAGAVLLAMVLSEVARGIQLSRFAVAAVLGVALIGVMANLPRIQEGKDLVDREAAITRAAGTMFNLAGNYGDPAITPARDLPATSKSMWIQASDYQQFTERYGSLDMPLSELQSTATGIRTAADRILLRSLHLRLIPSETEGSSECAIVPPSQELSLNVGAGVVRSRTGAQVSIRRFGDRLLPLGEIPADSPRRFVIPTDRAANIPWILHSDVGSFKVCRQARN